MVGGGRAGDRKRLEARHKREQRRVRTDELRSGLADGGGPLPRRAGPGWIGGGLPGRGRRGAAPLRRPGVQPPRVAPVAGAVRGAAPAGLNGIRPLGAAGCHGAQRCESPSRPGGTVGTLRRCATQPPWRCCSAMSSVRPNASPASVTRRGTSSDGASSPNSAVASPRAGGSRSRTSATASWWCSSAARSTPSSAPARMHAAAAEVDPDDPVHLRVGISVGEVAHEDDDWFGTPVVEAARLCTAADGGPDVGPGPGRVRRRVPGPGPPVPFARDHVAQGPGRTVRGGRGGRTGRGRRRGHHRGRSGRPGGAGPDGWPRPLGGGVGGRRGAGRGRRCGAGPFRRRRQRRWPSGHGGRIVGRRRRHRAGRLHPGVRGSRTARRR